MANLKPFFRFLAVAALALALIAGAEGAARAQDLAVTFPQGWPVTDLPVTAADGHSVAGRTSRAVLSSQTGRPLAAIELTREPQPADHMHDLQDAAKQMQIGTSDVYSKAGLALSCLPAMPIQVAGTGGLDIQCDATRDGQALVRQRIILWSKPGMLASLSYTSSVAEFAAHLDAFKQTLASVAAD
jgi:hypothetical protein